MEETGRKKVLSLRTKLGYSIGSITDTIGYDFVVGFLLYFLTDAAGVSPGFAGALITIGVIWDVITDPVVGALGDRTHTRIGSRVPWMFASAVPFLVTMILLFSTFDMSMQAKNIYYVVLVLCYWTSYTMFGVSWYSLPAVLVNDESERASLRSMTQGIQYFGMLFSGSLPMIIVGYFLSLGKTPQQSWQMAAAALAILGTVCCLICCFATKGKEQTQNHPVEKSNVLQDVLVIFKNRAFLNVVGSALLFRVAYAFLASTTLYYVVYVAGLTEYDVSLFYVVVSISGIVISFIHSRLVLRFEIRNIIIITMVIQAIWLLVMRFTGIHSMTGLAVFACGYMIGTATYFGLIWVLFYNTIEINEYKSGKRLEGTATAIFALVQKLGYALAAPVVGALLAKSGYDPSLAVQPESAISAITNMFMVCTAVFGLLCALALLFYPLNKEKHSKLVDVLEKRRNGEEYSIDGLEKILK